MIYLKKHNLLFIKPLKTASTSVEIALSCNATAEDIVTPISVKDELLRLELGGQLPVNYSRSSLSEAIYRSRVRFLSLLKIQDAGKLVAMNARLKSVFHGGKRRIVYNHIKPDEIIKRKGEAFLKDSFVVTMCRHPYDVLVSRVFWERFKKGGDSDFDVEREIDNMLKKGPLNFDYYFLNEKFIPDYTVKYEDMTNGLKWLDDKFNLKLVENLPVTKNTARKKEKEPKDILTEEQRERCYEINRQIFNKFGYEK